MKIKVIIFDSSALINIPKKELQEAFKKMIEYYLPFDKAMKAYKSAFKKLQKGSINEDEFFKQAFKDLPEKNHKKVIKDHDKKRDELVRPVKGFEVIETLIKDYKLGLISNMPKEWFLKDAKRLGINIESFTTTVFGNKAINGFKKTIKQVKEKPNRCVYVTNHESEIEIAQVVGMTVISLGINGGDLRIDSLRELIDLLHQSDYLPKNTGEVRTVSR